MGEINARSLEATENVNGKQEKKSENETMALSICGTTWTSLCLKWLWNVVPSPSISVIFSRDHKSIFFLLK